MIKHYFILHRGRILRTLGAVHDLVMACSAFVLTEWLVPSNGGDRMLSLPLQTILFVFGCAGLFFLFELNRGSWRYASVPDLVAIVKSSTIAVTAATITHAFPNWGAEDYSLLRPLLLWLLMVTGLSGARILYRVARETGWMTLFGRSGPQAGLQSILIYKANDIAEAYIRAVKTSRSNHIQIAGVIDDGQQNGSRTVQGQRVLGGIDDLPAVIHRLDADFNIHVRFLAVAEQQMDKRTLSELVNKAGDCGLQVRQIPDIMRMADISGQASLEPKPIELSDLLGRDEIKTDLLEITRFVEGRTVLVTGAGGSIGSEIVRQIAGFNPRRLVLADMSEHFLYLIDMELREAFPGLEIIARIADIRDGARIDQLFRKYKPDIVFHAAAIKHVPMAEQNIAETIKTNVLGTRNCALAAMKHKSAVFVMISTDKAVNPTNVMGATKRAAEAYCQALDLSARHTRFKTVRFGNVLGSNGSVVPRFSAQIARGGPVTVTHPNIVRYFMTIPEAVRLVLQASAMGAATPDERGKILVLDMGEPVRIADLAERMIRLAGLRPGTDIKIEYTGLRPGEKLYEELFAANEIQGDIRKGAYMVVSPIDTDRARVEALVERMDTAIAALDVPAALAVLHDAVPEFDDRTGIVSEETLRSNVARLVPRSALSAIKPVR